MEGSWAGAMGHFQFMPSTFQSYALDADGNGKIDIWHNFDDALLSAANYLSSIGWKTDEPWGMPVELPWKFDYSQTGRNDTKTIKEWKKLGVQIKGLKDDVEGAIIVPEGYRGKAYLILDNFHIIMKWNRSENYALAVGLLADKIKNNQTAEIKINTNLYPLTKQEILKIQKFINQRKIIKIDEDGALGAHTKKAVQKLQQKFKLPADGYPDYRLLKDIDNFSKNGYYPPLPSRKLHRGK
jgi:membrane-bound lytic murein transglycosylase B